MAIPADWSVLVSGDKVSCVQDYTNVFEGATTLEMQTGGNAANEALAHVRRSGAFAAPALDSIHAFWVRPSGSNAHYLGLVLRNQSAAASAAGVAASDITGEASYFVRVNVDGAIEILRGPVSLSQTKIYPAGAGVVAPSLPEVSGGFYWRVRLLTLDGAPTFRISQSAMAAPALRNEAHWTTLADFADESEDAVAAPGYAGLAFLNGGVNRHSWRVDRYMDFRYA